MLLGKKKPLHSTKTQELTKLRIKRLIFIIHVSIQQSEQKLQYRSKMEGIYKFDASKKAVTAGTRSQSMFQGGVDGKWKLPFISSYHQLLMAIFFRS